MKTTRLEAFSDGVLAIIITIMVLELKVPHAVNLSALKPVLPVLLSYVLSCISLGMYWNNHHHTGTSTLCYPIFSWPSFLARRQAIWRGAFRLTPKATSQWRFSQTSMCAATLGY